MDRLGGWRQQYNPGARLIPAGFRRWLPPICLVALVAVVWVLPYRPDCDFFAWDKDPAIARVDNECIRLSAYLENLRVIERGIEYAERELATDAPYLHTLLERHQRVLSYGPETVALAVAVADSVLYQRAVAEGHTPAEEEVSTVRDQDRLRTEGLADLIELVKLAQAHDEAGFTELLVKSNHPDLVGFLENSTPSELMADLAEDDWRLLEQFLEEREAYLKAIGRERYWQEILPAKLRREMAIDGLENAVLDAGAYGPDGPYAEVPRLAWLAYQQKALEEASIELTLAAPSTVSVDRALAYLAEFRTQEQEQLREEYRRLLERREKRRKLTPPPPRR